jgi:hypothetical protein
VEHFGHFRETFLVIHTVFTQLTNVHDKVPDEDDASTDGSVNVPEPGANVMVCYMYLGGSRSHDP